jgi:hypothetical protein
MRIATKVIAYFRMFDTNLDLHAINEMLILFNLKRKTYVVNQYQNAQMLYLIFCILILFL